MIFYSAMKGFPQGTLVFPSKAMFDLIRFQFTVSPIRAPALQNLTLKQSSLLLSYYMASVFGRYNACSDWLRAATR